MTLTSEAPWQPLVADSQQQRTRKDLLQMKRKREAIMKHSTEVSES